MQQLCWQIYFRCKIQMLGMKRLMNFYRSSLIFWRYSVFGPIFSGTTCEAPISSFSNTIGCKLSAIMITKKSFFWTGLAWRCTSYSESHRHSWCLSHHRGILGAYSGSYHQDVSNKTGRILLLVSVIEKLNAETPMKLRASVKNPCDLFNK